MKARGYKANVIANDSYTHQADGVLLVHPTGTFRFRVSGLGFVIQMPTARTVDYGRRRGTQRTEWHQLRGVFSNDEAREFRFSSTWPQMGDLELLSRVEAAIKANDDEESMSAVRQARRMALREAAPDMWRALRVIVMTPQHKEYLEEIDPQALKQCLDALAQAGEQDTEDLSVSRSGMAGD